MSLEIKIHYACKRIIIKYNLKTNLSNENMSVLHTIIIKKKTLLNMYTLLLQCNIIQKKGVC